MGFGKTPTTLAAIEDSLNDRFDTERWLVVAPKLVALDAWPRQLRRWEQFKHLSWRNLTAADFGLKAEFVDLGNGDKKRAGLTFGERADKAAVKRVLQTMREQIHIVSWDMFPWLVKAMGRSWPYDGLVLDEAIFAANATSTRHRAAWQVVHALGKVKRLIELTGSPMPNSLEQLHGQIRLLDGGAALGKSKTAFQSNWMMPKTMINGRTVSWKPQPGAQEAINGLLAGLCMSVKGSAYLDLPECLVAPFNVSLPSGARQVYDELMAELLSTLDNGTEILAPGQAQLVGKLQQVAQGAVYDSEKKWHAVHDAKLDALTELVDITEGPILLAYKYGHDWERIKALFGKHAMNVKEKGALDKFRGNKVKLLCMQPGSGAHGLDGLQEVSSTAIWYGATYNADHWGQFNARLHRDGQRANRVVIHQILAADTIEQYLAGRVIPNKLQQEEILLEACRALLPSTLPSRPTAGIASKRDEMTWMM